jgi:hypothetical protein
VVVVQKIWLADAPLHWAIVFLIGTSLAATIVITFLNEPADTETLVRFYAKIRPFGFWGPVRREAVRRGLVPENDPMPRLDVANAFIASFFQLCLGITVFYMFLKEWPNAGLWALLGGMSTVVLYFTWYKYLPSADEV